MNYPAFEVFGTQHLITLLICAGLVYSYIKYFQIQTVSKQILGGKIVAVIIIIHMLTQPIYDVMLFDLPWQGEFPLHMCDFSMIAMIIYLLKDNAPKILFNCAIKPTLGMVLTRESIICRKAGTTVIILKTLIILSNLATKTLSTLLIGTNEIVTIKKSKIFQPSLKNFFNELMLNHCNKKRGAKAPRSHYE